jgi:hypothetical protein
VRTTVGVSPGIPGRELVTLAVMQARLGFTSEARWLRFAPLTSSSLRDPQLVRV